MRRSWNRMETGVLLLEDGSAWEGKIFGAAGEAFGEAVFNTAFSGYEEVLTDPSYAGQIVVMTSPHLGNYGINGDDMESAKCHLRAFVVKDASIIASNWRSRETLPQFLAKQGAVGLSDVDTRGIVKHLREFGAMRGVVASGGADREALLEKVKSSRSMVGANFMKEVTAEKIIHYEGSGKRVALFDFGLKKNILRSLLACGLEVHVVPAFTPPEEVAKIRPEAVMFSNGPGDPAALGEIIENARALIHQDLPLFGICLGYQILSLAFGAKTFKLKFGHRGVNHPVKNLETGEVAITSHNHGFAVDVNGLPKDLVATYKDLYDGTLEGFRHVTRPIAGVQFHPEAAPGPHDAHRIFEQFTRLASAR